MVQYEYSETDVKLLCTVLLLCFLQGCAVTRHTNLNSKYKWDILHTITLKTFKGTTVLEFSPDGKLLAAADSSMVYLLDIESGTIQGTLWAPDTQALAFSSDGTLLACGKGTPITIVHEFQSDKLVFKLSNPKSTLHLYDIVNAQYIRSFETNEPIYAVAFKGYYGLYSGSDRRINEWGLSLQNEIRQMKNQSDKMDDVYTSVVKGMTANS